MAKKITSPLEKKKLEISRVLYALDTRDKDFYNNLPDDEKKLYSPVVIQRFMSSSQNQGGLHEYHVEMVNGVVNDGFWEIVNAHPELMHKLLSVCGSGKKQYHEWIPNAKKTNSSKLEEFFATHYPDMNDIEFKLFIRMNDEKDFKNLAKDYALSDKEIKELLKQFNELKSNE